MRSLVSIALLLVAACDAGPARPRSDAICQHYAQLAGEYGLVLAKDGSDTARCVKDEERRRRKLGDAAYAPYASCLMAAKNLVEWMACDPWPAKSAGGPAHAPP